MGTVHALAVHESATVAEASDAYLATLAGPESTGTLRVYAGVLRAFAEGLGADTDVADLKPRALTRDDIAIRERTLWRMLYETAARSAEVLRLDVEDLDMPNRKAKIRRKGGAIDVIVWQTGTARLLPRLLKGRKSGPVFLTDRRARVELPPCDIDQVSGRARLSYRQAEDLFKAASGGATLHQLRHSALTHDAEAGASTPMLMAKIGHTSVASLARYARPSAEALARWQERSDPARRR
jgi:integrase/recombinase XerC/integrase/recombinase XerD